MQVCRWYKIGRNCQYIKQMDVLQFISKVEYSVQVWCLQYKKRTYWSNPSKGP